MITLAGRNFSSVTELPFYFFFVHDFTSSDAHHIFGSLFGELYIKRETSKLNLLL